ncbi:hypothetical protein Tco_1453094, partial [Tanacetum coccineum]
PTMVVQAQEEIGEGSAMPTDPHHTPIIIQPSSSQPQRKQKSRRSKRQETEVPQPSDPTNIADEAVYEEPTQEITSLKKRDKKLEKKGRSRTHKLKRLYKVGRSARIVSSDEASLGNQEDTSKQGRKIHDIDADEDITLKNVHDDDMFDVSDLAGEEVFVAEQGVPDNKKNDAAQVNIAAVSTASIILVSAVTITENEITLAQELQATTPTISLQLPSQVKGQGSKDKAKFDEEDRLAREKAQQVEESNIAWDDIQAKIDADYQLAERLQVQEQQELTIQEKSTLFQQLLEKRRKFFAAKRVEEKRNRPHIRAQQRSIMCTYLKNIAGRKTKDLKNKSFANIQELFDKAMKRVNTFVDMDTELVEGSEVRAEGGETREESSSKRAGDELKQESTKKQKMDDDKETAKLKSLMKIFPDEEEVAIDAIPLATKHPSIVDYKIIKEGKISYYQIIRVDGSLKRPEEGYERVLWGDLKIMFEHHVEDLVWRNLQGNKVLGRIVGIKSLHDDLEVTAAQVRVTAAK